MAGKKRVRRARARAGKDQSVQLKLVGALHQVWLAGLGAVVKAQQGAPKLLDELIAEGAKFQSKTQAQAEKALSGILKGAQSRFEDVQSQVGAQVGDIRGRAGDALENLEKVFESRVRRTLAHIGMPSAEDIASLSRRVDALNANVEKFARRRPAASRSHVESSSRAQ